MFTPVKYMFSKISPPSEVSEFKAQYTTEKRTAESKRIRDKHPGRVPIILEKSYSSDVIDIDKHKFVCPEDITISQFMIVIRERLNLNGTPLDSSKSIIIFVGRTVPSMNSRLKDLDEKYRDEDGFLYITYAAEATYG